MRQMAQTTASNNQAPPSAGFFIYVQNEFDTVTALRYYLLHEVTRGATRKERR